MKDEHENEQCRQVRNDTVARPGLGSVVLNPKKLKQRCNLNVTAR